MITSFEVGAVFKIVNQGSPALRKILGEVREINKLVKQTTGNIDKMMAAIGGTAASIAPALADTKLLASEWRAVSTAAQGARRSITSAAAANATAGAGGMGPRLPNGRPRLTPPGGGGGRNGGGGRGNGGGIGGHFMPSGVAMPGGHFRPTGGGAAMAAGGALAYGIYKEAQLKDSIFMMEFHAGMAKNDANDKYFRDLIQNTASQTGIGYKEIAEAATDEIRLMKGADGKASGGIGILPEMLKAAAIEAKLKPGTTLKGAMESLVQQAHMAQEYGLEEVKGMAPLLAFLSTTNPATMPQMVRAASYAMPTLHSGLNVAPADVLYATTAIARAGATNTKSGTWVRAAIERLLPPDSRLMSSKSYAQRMFAGQQIGLFDKNGKSTVLDSTGNIDLEKAYQTIGDATKNMPIGDRNNFMKKTFGEQGQRGMSLLMAPKVREQTAELKREFPEFLPRYNSFMGEYSNESPIQKARQTGQDLTAVLSDIGTVVLPPVTSALRDFDAVLKAIKGTLPKGSGTTDSAWAKIGGAALGGAAIGAGVGAMGFGVGAIPGALTGAVVSGGLAAGEIFLGLDKSVDNTKKAATVAAPQIESLSRAIQNLGHSAGGFHPYVPTAPAPTSGMQHHSDIILDGAKVGKAVTRRMASRANRPPEGSAYYDPTHGVSPNDMVWSQG